jgi:hypothetical protein
LQAGIGDPWARETSDFDPWALSAMVGYRFGN